MSVLRVFADGGLIGSNPCPEGGVYAFVHLQEGRILRETKGIVTAVMAGLTSVTNSYTELLAAVLALEAVPDEVVRVQLFTDNFATVCRLRNQRPAFVNIPSDLTQRTWAVRARVKHLTVTLLDGHPTKKQLETGIGKRGNPVSKYNVLCDELCRQAKDLYKAGLSQAQLAEEVRKFQK